MIRYTITDYDGALGSRGKPDAQTHCAAMMLGMQYNSRHDCLP